MARFNKISIRKPLFSRSDCCVLRSQKQKRELQQGLTLSETHKEQKYPNMMTKMDVSKV